MNRRVNYRKLAFDAYPPICACCGFGVPEVLEVAHLDGDRIHNAVGNLAILCPNCHKMHDIGLIPTAVSVEMRDRERSVDWSIRLKDAGQKAALTRRRKAAARKAWETQRSHEDNDGQWAPSADGDGGAGDGCRWTRQAKKCGS